MPIANIYKVNLFFILDCAHYKFWAPDQPLQPNSPIVERFPYLSHYTVSGRDPSTLSLHGENFSRDLQVWFGTVRSPHVEYRGRELLLCRIPDSPEENTDPVHILLVLGNGTVIHKTNHIYQYLY